MIDFSVTIEGLDKLDSASAAVQRAVADEMNKGVYASAQHVVTEAKKSILDGHATGRFYKRRSVIHRASSPGEAPASDHGDLASDRGLRAEVGDPGEALAIAGSSSVKYAPMLEFGTSKMAARPFMIPAIEKSRAWIVSRLQEAFRRGISK